MLEENKTVELTEEDLEKVSGGKEVQVINEDADENRDTVSIYNLLKENLDMWKSEEEDK